MIFKFALRNVLRNKRRTFFTALSIFFGAMIVGLGQGWIGGMTDSYFSSFIKYQTGNIKITTGDYIKKEKFMPVNEIIDNPNPLIEKIKKIKGVSDVKERIRFGILLGNGEKTVQAFGMGIDLLNNKLNLNKKIIDGKLKNSGMYIGQKLAKKLKVAKGQKILIASKTSEGGLNAIKLKVEGIFHLGMQYDKNFFIIGLKDAKKLLKIHNGATEIYVFTDSLDNAGLVKSKIAPLLPDGTVAKTFKEQMGSLASTLESTKSIYAFIEAIILFLASFVIINTIMMAIFERLREIGTLKAMGMTNRQLFLNFTMEGAIIGAMGGILGATLGILIVYAIGIKGVDLSSQLASIDMPIEYIIRPVVHLSDYITALIIALVVPTLAAMIPARYARKLMPAEALRK